MRIAESKVFWITVLMTLLMLPACEINRAESGDTSQQNPTAETPFPNLGDAPDAAIGGQGSIPTDNAVIESVEFAMLESFPVQANAIIKGVLPNNCTLISEVNQAKNGDEFTIVLVTTQESGAMCVDQPEPFEKIVPLDILGLTAGTYTVTVSGDNTVSNTFALTVDNAPPQAPATPELSGASIDGLVWDDSCRLNPDGTPTEGCTPYSGGGFSGDGVLGITEARLRGVNVQLRRDACPGSDEPLTATTTNAAGTYLFTNLLEGTYCVTIDANSRINRLVLRAGNWSYPAVGVGSATVKLSADDYQTADFGWDFQFSAPLTEAAQPEGCTNAAVYVADVTIPDNTELTPDESFEKTWRIQNTGTCTWSTGYRLAFAEGNPMGGPPTVPLAQSVPPGSEVEISVSLTAPDTPGPQRSDWMLQAPDGTMFGSNGNFAFYLQIVVVP